MTARERRIQRKLKASDSTSTQPVGTTAEMNESKPEDGKPVSKRQSKTGADQRVPQVRRCMTAVPFFSRSTKTMLTSAVRSRAIDEERKERRRN